jgi:ATP-binding cassette subfamily G (WHITE) protein 2 (SNQ2)
VIAVVILKKGAPNNALARLNLDNLSVARLFNNMSEKDMEDTTPRNESRGTTASNQIDGHAPSSNVSTLNNFELPRTSGSSESEPLVSRANDWHLMPKIQHFKERDLAQQRQGRRLGVTWRNLTVKGVDSGATYNENMLSQYNILQLAREGKRKPSLKTILNGTHGCVKPGEMLLVLGRPGSGCTSLLKMLSNRRKGYAEIEGDVFFGSLDHKEAKQYSGQIVMNTEEEIFFPTLEVGQTMDFATKLKVPFKLPIGVNGRKDYQCEMRDFLLHSMGIDHTKGTKVGNEYVRGVSGGERKRVSIIETLATRGSVYCWDNSTRGLDASTALEYTRAIRAMTDVLGFASIVTLYQAGNGIYDLFDKVLVLDEGLEVYYGPMTEARPYMERLGFICHDGANVADFLTGVTVPTEREIQPGFENTFPRTSQALYEAYEKSDIKAAMIREYDYPQTEEAQNHTQAFKEEVQIEKHKFLPKSSNMTTSFATQVRACVRRQYQIIWGDKSTFYVKQGSTVIQALITGSLFYNSPGDSTGLFLKSGAIFFALLFFTIQAMSEVIDSFTGRPVLAKHKSFALFHPAAFCLAQIAADIPIIIFQVSHLSLVIYFMVGLKMAAGAFFTFWVICIATSVCMTACFRAIGAAFTSFDAASKAAGFVVTAYLMYAGFQITHTAMHPWFGWIYWINPLSYGFDALLRNEFHGVKIPCANVNLIPNGPGYADTNHQSCAGVPGAVQGATSLTGEQYLDALTYGYNHIWRNFGIIWAWWALFVAITIWATCNWKSSSESGGKLIVPRENVKAHKNSSDEESQEVQMAVVEKTMTEIEREEKEAQVQSQLLRNTSVFTWKNITYTVQTPSGPRVLLDNVAGWVKPGMLGALMGSSGAGKTTLLDVLAQRKTDGVIHGSIQVDGRPLSLSFQRNAGYCEQLDVHEPFATVREALEFSAILRQPRNISREDKLRYVDTIIDLLEMHDIENSLIGKIGSGLSVEQRKRVTIGVELVSKPSILIFLDEPTSGLDGQAAFNIVRFLRKLADVGQAVLVTIHQPSAQLFAQFDTLLLLAKGGKTVYFGDIGQKAVTVKSYFEKYGAPCPPNANPAEHMIDVITGSLGDGKDWAEVWNTSPEHEHAKEELDQIITEAAAKPPGTTDDGFQFAMPLWEQIKIVSHRANVALFRNTEYVNNKMVLHIIMALFNGFSFWKIGNTVSDLQMTLFAVFNFIFVAPGVINQLQPLFIERRNIYDAREKKSKMYSWVAFVTGLIVSEIPYLCICAVLYFVCWYWTVGFPSDSNRAGGVFFVVLMYEFVYTGIGQFIAAYAPNAVAASLVNPVIIGTLVCFCGVLVPYAAIPAFWRYWIYYLNPFNYLMGSILTFTLSGKEVTCSESEFALFDPPANMSCSEYLSDYMNGMGARSNLVNPDGMAGCKVCQYSTGDDYLASINLLDYTYGWRDAAIVVIFAISSYGMVYLLMKLRTKASKRAE